MLPHSSDKLIHTLFPLTPEKFKSGGDFPLSLQVYSRASSIISSSPQRSLSSEADGERQFNLNGNSIPTVTQALMTMYRRRSPEEFNPKLVCCTVFVLT